MDRDTRWITSRHTAFVVRLHSAGLSFSVCRAEKRGFGLGAPAHFNPRFECPSVAGFSTGHQFARLFFLRCQTAAISTGGARKDRLTTTKSNATCPSDLCRAPQPQSFPSIYWTAKDVVIRSALCVLGVTTTWLLLGEI